MKKRAVFIFLFLLTVVNFDSVHYWIEQKNDVLVQTRLVDTYLQPQFD